MSTISHVQLAPGLLCSELDVKQSAKALFHSTVAANAQSGTMSDCAANQSNTLMVPRPAQVRREVRFADEVDLKEFLTAVELEDDEAERAIEVVRCRSAIQRIKRLDVQLCVYAL